MATSDVPDDRDVQGRAVCPRMPLSIPNFTRYGPARVVRVYTMIRPSDGQTPAAVRPQHPAGATHDLPGLAALSLRLLRRPHRPLGATARAPVLGSAAASIPVVAPSVEVLVGSGSPTVTRAVRAVLRARPRQHLAVARAGGEQLVVRAVGHDPAAVDQHHAVGEGDRGRAVGDDDRRPPLHHLGQRVADLVLLGRVDRGRRVVEDQHPWVGQDGPGDGDALALPAATASSRARRSSVSYPSGSSAMNSVGAGRAGRRAAICRSGASGSANAMLPRRCR